MPTTSAAVSDRLADQIDELQQKLARERAKEAEAAARPVDRARLARDLAEAERREKEDFERLHHELSDVEAAIERHEYAKLLARREELRGRVQAAELTRGHAGARLRRQLQQTAPPEVGRLAARLRRTLHDERQRFATGMPPEGKQRERYEARLADLASGIREAEAAALQADPLKAVAAIEKRLNLGD